MGKETRIEETVDAGSVRLRPDLIFYPLDDGLVIFSETEQSLIGLNATAALIAGRLRNGEPASSLAVALAASEQTTPEEAAGWVAATVDALDAQGLLADGRIRAEQPIDTSMHERLAQIRATIPPLVPFEPRAVGHYRLLDTHLMVRYAHRSQKRMVDAAIGHLASVETGEPHYVMDISGREWGDAELSSNIYCDGSADSYAKQLSNIGPLVKSAFLNLAIRASDFILHLHAGVVGRDGRCILLPAESGSGKSSMTAALVHAGLGYYSDEIALIESGSFRVRPVPLATCVKDSGWPLMSRYYPEIDTLPKHRRYDGKLVRYLPPRREAVQTMPAVVSHIFFPQYIAGEVTRIEPLARTAALARLLDQCLSLRQRLDQENVQGLIDWIGQIDCFALPFSSLDEAVELVKDCSGLN